jgi:hypothetical protein
MFSAAAVARAKVQAAKRKNRTTKAASAKRSRVAALPKIPKVILDANYVNPITLDFPRKVIAYEIRNRFTGRTNYYDKDTFRKLITAFKNDYNLLMMNPKEPIPGARNPVTRNPIYPRNVRRVTVAAKKKTPSPTTAAKKIQNAVRKHLSKKRAAAKSKTPVKAKPKTPSPNKRKTPSPNKRKTPSKSKSKSKSRSK